MEAIELTPEALKSFQVLIRMIKQLDGELPSIALVKNQAEAVENMVDGEGCICRQQQKEDT